MEAGLASRVDAFTFVVGHYQVTVTSYKADAARRVAGVMSTRRTLCLPHWLE